MPPKNPLRHQTKEKQQNDAAKPKLVQSIEQFLLAFGYPLHSISSAPEDKKGKMKIADRPAIRHADTLVDHQQRREMPVPYLVASGILGCVLRLDGAGTQASLGEALLLGALDPIDDIGGGGNKAWIGNGGEVVVEGGEGDAAADTTPMVVTLPPPVRTKSSRRKPERRRMSDKDVGMGLGVSGLPTPPESAEGSSRSRSRSHSSMESSGYTSPSDDEAEVRRRGLGRSASGRRGGGVKERLARRRSRRSAHVHAQNAPLQGLGVPRQERGDSLSHIRKPSLKKRTNPLSALLHSQRLSYQGLTDLKFWSRREVRVGGVDH